MRIGSSAVLAIPLLCLAAWSQLPAAPAAGTPEAAILKRDFESCHAHANLDACYDAIRWNPSDPALLVALGDALEHARHSAEAIRAYRRAAALAPNLPGVAAKISEVEEKMSSKRAPGNGSARGDSSHEAGKRYSNAAPEAQSH